MKAIFCLLHDKFPFRFPLNNPQSDLLRHKAFSSYPFYKYTVMEYGIGLQNFLVLAVKMFDI